MKKLAKILVKFTGVIIFGIILFKTDWNNLSKTFAHIRLVGLIPVYLLLIPTNLLSNYRWHIILKKISINRTFWNNLKLCFSGFLLGVITPGRIGELYIVIRLGKEGYSKIKGAFSIIFTKLFDLGLMFFLSILAIYFLSGQTDINLNFLKKSSLAGLIIILLIFLVLFVFKKSFAGILRIILRKAFKINIDKNEILDNLKKLDFSLFLTLGLLTLGFWLLYFFQIYLLGRVLGIELPYLIMVLLLSIVTLAAALPITFIGLGTREFAMINCLAVFGIDRERSLALSLMVYSFFLINIIIATIFWNIEHRETD